MNLSSVRPRVAEMTFQLLGRSVHPELFQIHKTHPINRDLYSAQICITSDGHCITWKSGSSTLTEIASSANQLVPTNQRLFSVPLRNKGRDQLDMEQGGNYRYNYELQRVPAKMFWMIQKQLGESASTHELIHVFDSSGRMPIGGMSFVHVESRLRVLRIRAIHTFPDDLALVKTESFFTCPPTS